MTANNKNIFLKVTKCCKIFYLCYSKIILFLLFAVIIIFFTLIKLNFINLDFLKTEKTLLKDKNISNNDLFIEDCISSNFYAPHGKILDIGEDKYLIIGGINNLDYNTREKRIHIELYDNKSKKIIKVSNDLFYSLGGVIQLDNGNILIETGDKDGNKSYFVVLDRNTLNIKQKIWLKDLFGEINSYEFVRCSALNNNKILCINGHNTNNHHLKIYDTDNQTLQFGPKYHPNRIGGISMLNLDNDNFIIVGGYFEKEEDKTLIEICSINENKCKIQKSKVSGERKSPLLLKTQDNKILIIDLYNRNQVITIELFDPKNDTIEVIGIIPKNEIEFRTYTLLKNDNILITGGEKGILRVKAVNDAYIFDIKKRELKKIENKMVYPRSSQLTKLLDNGDVLICGGYKGLNKCERYITKK